MPSINSLVEAGEPGQAAKSALISGPERLLLAQAPLGC